MPPAIPFKSNFFTAAAAATWSRRLTPGHPRLYLTPRALPAFRAASQRYRKPWRDRLFGTLENFLTEHAVRTRLLRARPDGEALALGMAFRLTGQEKYAQAGQYLLESLEHCVHYGGSYDSYGMAAEAAAYLYDWLHPFWRARGLDRRVAEVVLHLGQRALSEWLDRYILDDWHNYALGNQAGALAAALAVGLDHPDLERGALLRTLGQIHFTGYPYERTRFQDFHHTPRTVLCLDAAFHSDEGAGFNALWESSAAYHTVDVLEYVKFAAWWTSALTPAARGGRPVWPELERAGEAIVHTQRPDGRLLAWGDASPAAPHLRMAYILFFLNARAARPEFEEILAQCGRPEQDEFPCQALLYASPPGRAPRTAPTAAFLNPLTLLRSGWDADATFVSFRCGRHGGWHNHFDHNSFTLFRGAALALDTGTVDYGSPHRTEYAARSIAHNAILVRNPRERHWWWRYRDPTVNEGGQRIVATSYAPPNEDTGRPHAPLTQERRERLADEFEMGRTIAFTSTPGADYVAGDATRAYTYPWSGLGDNPSRRVEEAVRQLVFLKPDLVVIFDRVEATRAEFEKRWLLHTAGAPDWFVDGLRRAARPGVRALPAGGPIEARNGRGRLTFWPLLPTARTLRAIGGPGFEFWVDGVAGAPGQNFPPTKVGAEAGAWRLELAPRRAARRDVFLTVLHAGLVGQRPARARFAFETVGAGEWIELRVWERARGRRVERAVVRFRERGPVEVEVRCAGAGLRHRASAPERVPQARRR